MEGRAMFHANGIIKSRSSVLLLVILVFIMGFDNSYSESPFYPDRVEFGASREVLSFRQGVHALVFDTSYPTQRVGFLILAEKYELKPRRNVILST